MQRSKPSLHLKGNNSAKNVGGVTVPYLCTSSGHALYFNFTKLGRNIKHDQTTCRDQQPSLHQHFLRNDSPL